MVTFAFLTMSSTQGASLRPAPQPLAAPQLLAAPLRPRSKRHNLLQLCSELPFLVDQSLFANVYSLREMPVD